MNNITKLKQLLTPPSCSLEVPSDPLWSEIEKKLGIQLPNDYKEFVSSYGSGSVDDFLWVFNPFSENPNINLFERLTTETETFEYLKKSGNETLLFSMYPEKRGLLPLGATDNGDVLFWQVGGNPSTWPIVINAARQAEYEKYEITLVDFLIKTLTGGIKSNIFPSDFPCDRPLFNSAC
ncbi:SMI1/KNR4 family protein [Alkalimarinus coralli]|uniref:SMI1/KNR4 family protein n=1 Tax=Alkalimarinus coralli TaxID=2935863 RepID=UPI00202B676C|nr:SMI1/KNR4 family protein [Alkalimarinus coralli]